MWDGACKSSSCSSIAGEFPSGTEQTFSSGEAGAGSVATLHAEVLHALTSAQNASLPCPDLTPLSLRQILFNNAIPDHEPSKEDVHLPEKRTPEHHPLVQCLLGGFGNWDSEYFIMIAGGEAVTRAMRGTAAQEQDWEATHLCTS